MRARKSDGIFAFVIALAGLLASNFSAPGLRIDTQEGIPPEAGFLARSYHSPTGETMLYRLFIPLGYDEHKKFPLILWLHNALARGSDNLAQISGTDYAGTHVWTTPEAQERFPVFVLAPQISDTKAWARPHANTPPVSIHLALEILDAVEKEYAIDVERVYVAGQSMGGEGTWMAMAVAPGRFAASVSLCGYGESWMIPLVAKTPVWIFQGDADDIVPVEQAREWVAALRAAGGSPKYTEYPGIGHQVWDKAFAEPGLMPWLSAQHRLPAN